MYFRLVLNGLLRHRKSGKRLFLLLALCSAAVLFFLSFRSSFTSRYRQLCIDTSTAHLQIVPKESPKIRAMAFADHRTGLDLLRYSPELQGHLESLPAVTGVMLAVETRAAIFTIDGEPLGSTPSLIGVDVHSFNQTLPGVRVITGSRDLRWHMNVSDIPVFRPPLDFYEIVRDNDRFVRTNFRARDASWLEFKRTVVREMPSLFQPGVAEIRDDEFLAALNAALGRADLPSLLPQRIRQRYDYHVDDALAALSNASAEQGPASAATPNERQLRILRKRVLQAVYPEEIIPVRDAVELNVPYTMVVPPARENGPLERVEVLPIRIVSFVQRIPLFANTYYVDGRVLRSKLGLDSREGTTIYVRLRSDADTPAVKKALVGWLQAHDMNYAVMDYREMGSLFMSTATAFSAITMILVALSIAMVVVFVVNTVLLTILKRRHEIGTAIALGLTPWQNVLVLYGETIAIVLISWAIGSIVGTAAILILHVTGIPGIVFLPGSRLFLDFRPVHVAVSLALLLSTSTIASFIPLRRVVKAKPVDLLKEAA